jgi:hypothetical protein
LHFVDDHQPGAIRQREFRGARKRFPSGRPFQVEERHVATALGDPARQGSLADLPCSE